MRRLIIVTTLVALLMIAEIAKTSIVYAKALTPQTKKTEKVRPVEVKKAVKKKAAPKNAAVTKKYKKTPKTTKSLKPAKIIKPVAKKPTPATIEERQLQHMVENVGSVGTDQKELRKKLSGSYRCWSYNVSGGGGGDCRLFAPIVLKDDGTYSMSSEAGTYAVNDETITLSESKIRGPGKLIDANSIRFEYDYNKWHHVITYLRESTPASQTPAGISEVQAQPSEVELFLILEYPAKDSGIGGISTVELVPEGEPRIGTRYRPEALAVWDKGARIMAYFHETSAPKTGKKYTVYTSTGLAAWAVGVIDLTEAKTTIRATLPASLAETQILSSAKNEAITPSTAPEIVVDIDVIYPAKDSSLGSIQALVLVPEGEDPVTAFYRPQATALWDGEKTVQASFFKTLNRVRTKAKYTVYEDWGFGTLTKIGTLDLTSETGASVKKTYQATLPTVNP